MGDWPHPDTVLSQTSGRTELLTGFGSHFFIFLQCINTSRPYAISFQEVGSSINQLSSITGAFQGSAGGKEPICQFRRHKAPEFNPWVRKIPWRRAWQLLPHYCLEYPMDKAWQATVHRVAKSQTQLKWLKHACQDNRVEKEHRASLDLACKELLFIYLFIF